MTAVVLAILSPSRHDFTIVPDPPSRNRCWTACGETPRWGSRPPPT